MNVQQTLNKLHKNEENYTIFITKITSPNTPKNRFQKKNRNSFTLKKPATFNDKIQSLKLNYYKNNPLISECTNKHKMHNYLARKNLSQYSVQYYGPWNSIEEIE